jgi:hypothetical protein
VYGIYIYLYYCFDVLDMAPQFQDPMNYQMIVRLTKTSQVMLLHIYGTSRIIVSNRLEPCLLESREIILIVVLLLLLYYYYYYYYYYFIGPSTRTHVGM